MTDADKASDKATDEASGKPSDPAPSPAKSDTEQPKQSAPTQPEPKQPEPKQPEPKQPEPKQRRARQTGAKVKKRTDAIRTRIASLVWLVAVLCALVLAAGALLVALKANPDNAIVKFVLDAADTLDLEVFSRDNGIFKPENDPQGVKSALINWGIGALAYLVVGKVLDRIIRP
jgi:hypothetical protein